LKLPQEDDYYNVGDFNENFELFESIVAEKFAEIEENAADFVTGVMTGNGAVNLGWQPKAVFVMCSDSLAVAQSVFGYSRVFNSMALAFPDHPFKSAGVTRLTVTETGFVTNGMSGYASDNAENDMRALLRYIAFK
jgi:hypothetical protein